MVHSDQGSQFTSYKRVAFLSTHDLQPSMSRRGNCHDNAAAESFFQLLRRERIKRKIYKSLADSVTGETVIHNWVKQYETDLNGHRIGKPLSLALNLDGEIEQTVPTHR